MIKFADENLEFITILESEDKPETKSLGEASGAKVLFPDEQTKDAHWKKFVKQAEGFEPRFIDAMQGVFEATKQEALSNIYEGMSRDTKLIDTGKFGAAYDKALAPVMADAMLAAVQGGYQLIEPVNPHKSFDSAQGKALEFPKVLNPFSLKWLKRRILWAANQVGGETEELLRKVLFDGFTAGEGTALIAKRIREIPGFADKARSERIARTEIISAYSQGTLDGYKDSGVVKKVEFYAAADERTCGYCMNYHEQQFEIGDQVPIPLHPNCRCAWLPIVEL